MMAGDKQRRVGQSVLGVLTVLLCCMGCGAHAGGPTPMSANEHDAGPRTLPEVATASAQREGATESSPRDFDFLLGEWTIQITRYAADGTAVQRDGSWSARALHGGKVIEDLFVERTDEDDAVAVTVRTYCAETQQWEMAYLWADRPAPIVTTFVGNRVDDEMHLTLKQRTPEGELVHSRIRFFQITDDSFSWDHRMSMDNGETWKLVTLLKVQRRSGSS